MLIWSSPGGGQLLAERGIVRAHEFATVTQLDEILGEAREEAQAIRLRAEEDAERLLDNALQQAGKLVLEARREADALREQAELEAQAERTRGYQEGGVEAAAEWHERFAELQARHDTLLDGNEDRLAGIVALAVERIVRSESRDAAFARALQGVREALREAGSAQMFVHPDEAAAAEAALAADRGANSDGPRIQVQADAALRPGACIFESPLGRLDASLDVQLAGMRAALQRATRMALAEAAEDSEAEAEAAGPEEDAQHAGEDDEEATDV
ncbi:type III secretion system stator protein SctL [Ideonella sp. YS5]|uniref:type III secretion system stator protein SctL n=1 Tax=Ideonella sp. YS5 TaxID=3453714 RepID=UPI003EF05E21